MMLPTHNCSLDGMYDLAERQVYQPSGPVARFRSPAGFAVQMNALELGSVIWIT